MTSPRDQLLTWYDANHRPLPWRVDKDPYKIWLAEIMSQQTTITAMLPYHQKFVDRWPTVTDLAAADVGDVLGAWAGLGYYARARNLHKCAQTVVARGGFPEVADELLTLPGIGPYTAAAIAAQAFGQPVVPVDGNVERVMARVRMIDAHGPALRKQVTQAVQPFADPHRPADFAQSLMELGALICRPKNPKCGDCPWRGTCQAFENDATTGYPKRPSKKAKPKRFGVVFICQDGDQILVEKRPDRGLLGGYWAPPSPVWGDAPVNDVHAVAPAKADWQHVGTVNHVFTHFDLDLQVWHAKTNFTGERRTLSDLKNNLPSVFAKALGYI